MRLRWWTWSMWRISVEALPSVSAGRARTAFLNSFQLSPVMLTLRYINASGLRYQYESAVPIQAAAKGAKGGESEGAGREVTKWGAALLMLARLHWNTQWSYSNGKTHALPSMLTTRWRAQLDGERERERRRGLDSRCTYSRGSRAMLEASAEKPLRWDGWGKVAQHLQPAGNWSIWKGGRKLNPRQVFNIVLSWKDLLNRSYRNSYTLKNYFNVFKLIWILGIVIQLTYQTLVVF